MDTTIINSLKKLYIETPLEQAVIAAGKTVGAQKAAAELSRLLKIALMEPISIELPLEKHIIALGSRENNDLIDRLYKQGFCYTDQFYPGTGGYELRSIHNPTGKGLNIILIGSGDDEGIAAATKLLLNEVSGEKTTVGHLMKIKAPGFSRAFNIYNFCNYQHHLAHGKFYYGWNAVSAVMALFYQTGDEYFGKEFLRLAFPDKQGILDCKKMNAESIETPEDPLSGPYHYSGHQMILLWDLIEEHPLFTDEQRLKIMQAFSRQLKHPSLGGTANVLREEVKNTITTARHGEWICICLYALGRYFSRDYHDRIWQDSIHLAEAEFQAANHPEGWIIGEFGILDWFISGSIIPAVNFFMLSGKNHFNSDGGLANALKFFEIHWDSSLASEIMGTASRQAFYMLAELTKDGKYLYYADLLPKHHSGPKIGSVYYPEISKRKPLELLNCWTIAPMKKAERDYYEIKASPKNCYLGLSWRDTLDTSGDFIAFNCFNDGYRNPYNLLSLYSLRINGKSIFQGFGNYVQTYLNGTTEPHIATLGEVYAFGAADSSIFFSGGVPDHSFCTWRRDVLMRKRKFSLIADTISPREKFSEPLSVVINFQTGTEFKNISDQPDSLLVLTGTYSIRFCDMQIHCKYEYSSSTTQTVFYMNRSGDSILTEFHCATPFRGSLQIALTSVPGQAESVNLYLDENLLAAKIHFKPQANGDLFEVPLGMSDLKAGTHQLRLEVDSLSEGTSSANIGVAYLKLIPEKHDVVKIISGGTKMLCSGIDNAVAKQRILASPDQPTTIFTLVCGDSPSSAVSVKPISERAALLQLPNKALIFTGNWNGIGQGTLILLEDNHIAGMGISYLASSLNSSSPLMADWDFDGKLTISASDAAEVSVNGKLHSINSGETLVLYEAPLDVVAWKQILAELEVLPIVSNTDKQSSCKKMQETQVFLENSETITFIKNFRVNGMEMLFVAAGKNLQVFNSSGQLNIRLNMSGNITTVAWSETLCAIIVGTFDEHVAAYTLEGEKLWSFTSEIAPEIEATQKFYWFKSTYPGITSLLPYKDKIYVGSTCTMEILDQFGKLITRLPQPWGPTRQLLPITASDDSVNIVGLRHSATNTVSMWTYNEKQNINRLSFGSNMSGYRHFPGFLSLYRTHAEIDDFDGDGNDELLCDAQGIYLWLNLYDSNGNPKNQINLGPGGKQREKVFDWKSGKLLWRTCRQILLINRSVNEIMVLDGENFKSLWSADISFRPLCLAVVPASSDSDVGKIVVAGDSRVMIFDALGSILLDLELLFEISGIEIFNRNIMLCGRRKVYKLIL